MITIIPYQTRWEGEFGAIAGALRSGIGQLAHRIDHIGSTSVPGLAAKDIVDVQVSVSALDDDLLNRFSALGYSRADEISRDDRPLFDDSIEDEWHKWFFRPPIGQRPTNTHVRVTGRANQKYPILFRDYLRSHPAAAAEYAELKRYLAGQLKDPSIYPIVKGPAVNLIYLAALDWAATSGRQIGSSDA